MGVASSLCDDVVKSQRKKSDVTELGGGVEASSAPAAQACMGEQRGYITQTFVVFVNMHVASNFLRDAA